MNRIAKEDGLDELPVLNRQERNCVGLRGLDPQTAGDREDEQSVGDGLPERPVDRMDVIHMNRVEIA